MGRVALPWGECYIPEPNSGCYLWLRSVNKKGYGQIGVHRKIHLAHRWAWERENGKIPEGLCVLHKCDTPGCVNPDHLFLGTSVDNNLDRDRKGRVQHGERHVRARLTEDQVRAIREDPRTTRVIGAEYGINCTAVSEIKRRVTWKHVE